MPKNTLDKAIAAVPNFGDRISLFTKKLRLAQYADGSIYDYRLKIAQAVLFINVHNKIIINDSKRNHAANLQHLSQSTKQIIKILHIYP